jgi:hypothetical protein
LPNIDLDVLNFDVPNVFPPSSHWDLNVFTSSFECVVTMFSLSSHNIPYVLNAPQVVSLELIDN